MSTMRYLLTILLTGQCVLGAVIPEEPATSTIETDLCDSQIYCTGDLLRTVQMARIFPDSKMFVDHYQLQDPELTLQNFHKFMNATNDNPNYDQTKQFVKENFAIENEVLPWTPSDWQPNPPLFELIEDSVYRSWAHDVNDIWKDLSRQISPNVIANPQRHSIIPVENGFVVPGGRFQEFYYWDSYWVVEGLLISGMVETAKGIIENFLSMVKRFGFIPNGGRVYYLMRSQPPLLIPMMQLYLDFTGDMKFLSENLVLLEKEFSYFQRTKTLNVTYNNKTYRMARYVVDSEGPRPESYREDFQLAKTLPDKKLQQELYKNLKAGAESGWDFSSRWFTTKDGLISSNLTHIATSSIIPVDLNAFLERNARLLSEYNRILGNYIKAKYYKNIASQYQEAIDEVLWNEKVGIWLDYDIVHSRSRNTFYPSNLTPLYTGSFNKKRKEYYAKKAVEHMKFYGIGDYAGGIPTSILNTTQQWDKPNAWAPLQSIVVQGLLNTESELAITVAKEFAERWLISNYMAYTTSGHMYEKYNAITPGNYGEGGEYLVQDGFGWTNGVILEFLYTFPDILSSNNKYHYDTAKYDDKKISVVHLLNKKASDPSSI